MSHEQPLLTVVAGVNGSGKSTFVRIQGWSSVDPHRLAAGYGQDFTPEANLRASREALREIADALNERRSLTVETTLAGRQPLRLMGEARVLGYRVLPIFVMPHEAEDTRLRIENRVLLGGHNIPDIPDADLERRTPRVLANLPEVVQRADQTVLLVSSARQDDFHPVGVGSAAGLWVTPYMPASVLETLKHHLAVQRVATLPEALLAQLRQELKD